MNSAKRISSSILFDVEMSLDRWVFQSSQEKTFFNYFSFGVDAAVVNRLQRIRNLYPFLFHFPSINNLWYLWCIILEAFFPTTTNLDCLSIKADDEVLSLFKYRTVVCLNIPYYCGGGLPLGNEVDLARCCDQEIEIVAFSGIIHILAAKVGGFWKIFFLVRISEGISSEESQENRMDS